MTGHIFGSVAMNERSQDKHDAYRDHLALTATRHIDKCAYPHVLRLGYLTSEHIGEGSEVKRSANPAHMQADIQSMPLPCDRPQPIPPRTTTLTHSSDIHIGAQLPERL